MSLSPHWTLGSRHDVPIPFAAATAAAINRWMRSRGSSNAVANAAGFLSSVSASSDSPLKSLESMLRMTSGLTGNARAA